VWKICFCWKLFIAHKIHMGIDLIRESFFRTIKFCKKHFKKYKNLSREKKRGNSTRKLPSISHNKPSMSFQSHYKPRWEDDKRIRRKRHLKSVRYINCWLLSAASLQLVVDGSLNEVCENRERILTLWLFNEKLFTFLEFAKRQNENGYKIAVMRIVACSSFFSCCLYTQQPVEWPEPFYMLHVRGHL
jgi:hypothetical protein